MDWFAELFDPSFMPHGASYHWQPAVLWLNVGADAAIALACYSISVVLATFVVRRSDVGVGWLFWVFSAFAFLYGTAHAFEIWNVWHGDYFVEGLLKMAAAGVSVATAAALWPMLPRALAAPSPSTLEQEIQRREETELELRRSRDRLEETVRERTVELERAIRELERSNHSLDEFAYAVSHDLQAPLRGITLVASWLQEDYAASLPKEAREHLDTLRERASHTSNLVHGILQYSRIIRARSEPGSVDTSQLVERVVEALPPDDTAVVHIQDELPYVAFDAAQLEQVFRNLIENALRHHGRDTVHIEIGGRFFEDRVELWVSDDGIGIEPRHHARIFKMFHSLDPGGKGTGVGLALVRRIVEAHGGGIGVESDHGGPTTFRFWVPKPN